MQGSNNPRESEIFTKTLVRVTTRRCGDIVPDNEKRGVKFLYRRCTYLTLTELEAVFRRLKSELGLRPESVRLLTTSLAFRSAVQM